MSVSAGLRMGGLLLALLLLAPAEARAACAACELARRDCRTQCMRECRGLENQAQQACRAACRAGKAERWAACDAIHGACEARCARVSDPACPEACLKSLRQSRVNLRKERKGCLKSCRDSSRAQRSNCRSQAEDAPGSCLKRVGEAFGSCVRSCDAGLSAKTSSSSATLERCLSACPVR